MLRTFCAGAALASFALASSVGWALDDGSLSLAASPACATSMDVALVDYCAEADCGMSCDNSCSCGAGCSDAGLLGGLIKPSDHCFDDFISPMTNPVFFEDPRTLTEARAIFLQHKVPLAAGGGDIQLYAVQLRAALTDRLSLIATKDGYAVSSNPLIADGWADVAAGLKYNLFVDPQAQRLLSAGLVYEMPVGTPRTQQGNGDGEFHLFMTGMAELMDNVHWISGSGFRLPADSSAESQSWYWSNPNGQEVVSAD
jgi:hypothetical protein